METTACTNCGAPLTDALRFCPKCGTGVARNGPAPSPMIATRPAVRVGPHAIQCGTCGTQMVAGLQYCFACGAPIQIDEGQATYRMQAEAAPMAPKRMSTGKKILIGVGIMFVCTIGACGACIAYFANKMPDFEMQAADQARRPVSPELIARMPADQAAFCDAINKASKETRAAGGLSATEQKVSQVAAERQLAISNVTANPNVTGWVGVVASMFVTNGMADITIQLPCDAHVTTRGLGTMPAKEPGRVTMRAFSARQGTPAYIALVQVHDGQVVSFDGEFGIDDKGTLQMANMSDRARLMAPNFLMQFSDVRSVASAPGTIPAEPSEEPAPEGGEDSHGK